MNRKDFVEKYKSDVLFSVKGTGLFPSVKMAQMIIESADEYGNAGEGIAAKKAKNFFGIKADKNWQGAKISFNTPKDIATGGAAVSFFRAYQTPLDSINDHTNFLQQNSGYKKVFLAKTPFEQVKEIKAAGYAGNPNYVADIMSVIKANDLTKLDGLADEKKNARLAANDINFLPYLIVLSSLIIFALYIKK